MKKLINITRPIDLPPLNSTAVKSNASQDKKKIQLPLFGKKKSFGFDKLKQQTSNQKVANPQDFDKSGAIEEFDEDDDATKSTSAQSAEKLVEETECKQIRKVQATKSCDEQTSKPISEATTVQKETKEQTCDKKLTAPINSTDHLKQLLVSSQPSDESIAQQSSESVGNTKNRSKNRKRNKMRHQIDIEDTEEDTSPQKFSGWMPPSNQSGDGITDLNTKYGY